MRAQHPTIKDKRWHEHAETQLQEQQPKSEGLPPVNVARQRQLPPAAVVALDASRAAPRPAVVVVVVVAAFDSRASRASAATSRVA